MSLPLPLTPAECFARIIATMVGMIGARVARPGKPGLAGPLSFAIHLRLQGIRNRITRYFARFQAGTLTPPRPRPSPAAPRPSRATPGKWDHLHLPKLPRGKLWLVRLVPGIGVGANYLQSLLDDPEMRAMLEAAPQIGRTLRPFWHMLSSQPLPPLLQRPRPEAAPPPPPRPAQTRAAPLPGQPRAKPSRPPRKPAPEVAGPARLLPTPA